MFSPGFLTFADLDTVLSISVNDLSLESNASSNGEFEIGLNLCCDINLIY